MAVTSPRLRLLTVTKVRLRHEPLFRPVKLVTPPQVLLPTKLASWFCTVSARHNRLPSTRN